MQKQEKQGRVRSGLSTLSGVLVLGFENTGVLYFGSAFANLAGACFDGGQVRKTTVGHCHLLNVVSGVAHG